MFLGIDVPNMVAIVGLLSLVIFRLHGVSSKANDKAHDGIGKSIDGLKDSLGARIDSMDARLRSIESKLMK